MAKRTMSLENFRLDRKVNRLAMNNSRFNYKWLVTGVGAILTCIAVISFTELPAIKTGADQPEKYLPILNGKRVALVANQTTVLLPSKKHLADFLVEKDVNLVRIFAPEHGFRGNHSAGALVANGKDVKTGLPIVSLYGDNRKPTDVQMSGLDYVIFDIQDVGARFYTYISTMHYVMESAAANNVTVLVLDRPNPHGNYIDGPVLKSAYSSFVGMHEVPVVHGMTIGEYAKMINNEGWLTGGKKCALQVIPVKGWTRNMNYALPIAPSPNLPNDISIKLYPSLCFFEGTQVSIGRGTACPFQVYGHPELEGSYRFMPKTIEGVSEHPKLENKDCRGKDLRLQIGQTTQMKQLDLSHLIDAYRQLGAPKDFFTSFFIKLAGTPLLQQQISQGMSEDAIRASWQDDLKKFDQVRQRYLLYQ